MEQPYYDKNYYEGVLAGLKICKEMWARGTISHEEIRENEIYYGDLLLEAITVSFTL